MFMNCLLVNVRSFSRPALISGPLMSCVTGSLNPDASSLILGHLTCLRSLFLNLHKSHPTKLCFTQHGLYWHQRQVQVLKVEVQQMTFSLTEQSTCWAALETVDKLLTLETYLKLNSVKH